MKDKNLLISFLQVFGIILVVIGHSFVGSGHQNDIFIRKWIYSFHMPLFIFISGYLLRYGIECKKGAMSDISLWGKKGFVYKKILRLLVPYLAISCIAYFPKAILSSFAIRSMDISFIGFMKMLLYPCNNIVGPLWFLPTLFLIFIIVVLVGCFVKGNRRSLQFLVVGVLLIHLFNPFHNIMFLYISGVFFYLFYFIFGYYFYYEKLGKTIAAYPIFFALLTFLLSVVLLFLPVFWGKEVLTSVNGIFMSIALGYLYVNYHCTFFQHLFGASYAIYLFSYFPQVLSQQVLLRLTDVPWQVGTCLAIILGIYVPLLFYFWIVKHKNKPLGKVVAVLTGQG